MTQEIEILQFLHYNPEASRAEIGSALTNAPSQATLKRIIANGYCPISFRTVDSIDYKKAMLISYEQNNIAAFKRIFIDQFLFAVKTYF